MLRQYVSSTVSILRPTRILPHSRGSTISSCRLSFWADTCKCSRSIRRLHTTPEASNAQEIGTDGITSQSMDGEQPPSSATKPRSRPSSKSLIYAIAFFLVGFCSGKVMSAIVIPPPLPLPDSPDDDFFLSKLRKDINELPLVKELRIHREEWLEYEAYMGRSQDMRATSLPAGTLRGSRGLGVQRVFWNKKERRLITIVYFGGALAGWPGVTHGGAIATAMQENLEAVANGPEFNQMGTKEWRLADVELRYRKPTKANALFAVRAEVDDGRTGVGHEDTKVYVKATLEDALGGFVCAEADGHCRANDSLSYGLRAGESGSLDKLASANI